MALRIEEDTLDAVKTEFRELYTEKDGKFILTGVEGMKTQGDIDRLQTALNKERLVSKEVKEKFAVFKDLDPTEVLAKLDRIPELEALAAGKVDDTKIETIVQSRISQQVAPLQRELEKIKSDKTALEEINNSFIQQNRQRAITDNVRSAASKANVRPEAIDDAITLAERFFSVADDGNVVTKEGLTPDLWLSDLQNTKPHWWGTSQGGGARGSDGFKGLNNPFSEEHWNLTEQGKLLTSNPTKAQQLAEAAGVKVGATAPIKKK